MVLNNLFINKNNIYKKLKDSFISYELIGTIEYLLFDNFQNIIIPFFISKFPIHFNNFDFYFLIKNFKNKMESDILKIKNITNNNIELDFNLMEFKDGIYNISKNTFISKKDLENDISHCKDNLCTIKYYDKSYNRVRQKDKSEKLYKSLTYNSKYNFGFYKYKEILEKVKKEKVPDYTGLKMKYVDH
jgi:hypothetical protein